MDNTITYEKGVRLVWPGFVCVRQLILRVQLHGCVCVFAFTPAAILSGRSVQNAGHLKQTKQNTPLWYRPHFSAARPVGWIHHPRIWVSFCGSWGFVFLRRSICSLRHLRHYAESWNFIHVLYVRLGCIHATLHSLHTKKTLVRVNSGREEERWGQFKTRSGVCLKTRYLSQQHAQEKAVQQQAEEETASSQAGEKAR